MALGFMPRALWLVREGNWYRLRWLRCRRAWQYFCAGTRVL